MDKIEITEAKCEKCGRTCYGPQEAHPTCERCGPMACGNWVLFKDAAGKVARGMIVATGWRPDHAQHATFAAKAALDIVPLEGEPTRTVGATLVQTAADLKPNTWTWLEA